MVYNNFIGKKVFIKTKSGRNYSGVVKEVVDSGSGLIFLSIIDKYSKWVTFTASEIELIEEERI